jgi:hypothetical protein
VKKGIIIFCLTVYIFSSFVIPVKRAEAAIPAAIAAGAAGVEIGVGAYVLGAIALGSIAAGVGLQYYGDEMKAHAQRVWENANQTIKDSMRASIAAAVQAGSNVVKLSQDVVDYLKDSFSKIYHRMVVPASPSSQVQIAYSSSQLALTAPAGHLFITYSLEWDGYVYSERVVYSKYGSSYGGHYEVRAETVDWNLTDIPTGGSVTLKYFPYADWVSPTSIFSSVPTFDQAINFLNTRFDVLPVLVSAADAADFANDYANNKDLWDSQIDAVTSGAMSSGVYVPFEDIKAYPIDNAGTRVSDQPLVWNDTTKVWERAEGGTWTGKIEWDFPIPQVTEGGKVVVGDTVAVGEGVGTKVGTGEEVGTGEGLLQDILTGVRTIADTLTTGLVGNPENINWDKLKMAGSAFTTSFPFSIPWDVGRALDAAFGSVEELEDAPTWEWKINLLGQQYPIRFKIDDYFLEWFGIIRSVMLIMFDIGLVYAVRKMLGGAS